jgi:hypothetical protein
MARTPSHPGETHAFPIRIRMPFGLAATCKLPVRQGETRPDKQDSAHAGTEPQNDTQRRAGVRMRHRRTAVRRNRKGRGMGDTPSWRQTHRRPLLFTRTACLLPCFFTACSGRCAGPPASGLPAASYSPCGQRPSRRVFRRTGNPASCARQDGFCKWQCRAAPSRRARECSSNANPTNTGYGDPWERARSGTETADAHYHSRALLVIRFFVSYSSFF